MQNIVNIAVVDDFPPDRERLSAGLRLYAAERHLPWQVFCFSGGADLLSTDPGRYAMVFLDIVMEGLDGLETARRLRAGGWDGLLVFVTTEADYAVDGYEVEAAGFLVKDSVQQKSRFTRLLERLERRLDTDPILDLSGQRRYRRAPGLSPRPAGRACR